MLLLLSVKAVKQTNIKTFPLRLLPLPNPILHNWCLNWLWVLEESVYWHLDAVNVICEGEEKRQWRS